MRRMAIVVEEKKSQEESFTSAKAMEEIVDNEDIKSDLDAIRDANIEEAFDILAETLCKILCKESDTDKMYIENMVGELCSEFVSLMEEDNVISLEEEKKDLDQYVIDECSIWNNGLGYRTIKEEPKKWSKKILKIKLT